MCWIVRQNDCFAARQGGRAYRHRPPKLTQPLISFLDLLKPATRSCTAGLAGAAPEAVSGAWCGQAAAACLPPSPLPLQAGMFSASDASCQASGALQMQALQMRPAPPAACAINQPNVSPLPAAAAGLAGDSNGLKDCFSEPVVGRLPPRSPCLRSPSIDLSDAEDLVNAMMIDQEELYVLDGQLY